MLRTTMGYGTSISSGRQEQRPKVQCSHTCSPTTQTIWYAGQSKSTSGPSKAKIVKLRNWRPLSKPYPLAVCTEGSVHTYPPNSFLPYDVLHPALIKFTNLVCKSWREYKTSCALVRTILPTIEDQQTFQSSRYLCQDLYK